MKKDVYDLTAPQNSIWLTEQFYQGTNINNICGSMTIYEKVDFNKFSEAINLFVKNTDSFRIKLFMDNTEVKQYISDYSHFNLDIIDVCSDDDVKDIEKTISKVSFNLIDSLLFIFKLFRFPDGHGGFVINAHHIISDSWTLGIVVNEIIRIYSCLLNNEDIDFSNNFSYVDYIQSEKDYLNSNKFLKDKEYWDSIFATLPEIATIPSVNANSSKEIFLNAERELISIDADKLISINKFCSENNVSIYNFFMAVFSIYLGRVSNLEDFVIGTPILNRTNFKDKHTAGMFINTIPLRITIDSNLHFKAFVSKIAIDSLGMLRHQKYSYQYILESLRKQDSSLPNLYSIMLSYQVTKMTDNNEVISHSSRWAFNNIISDDLDIHLYDFNDSCGLNIAYDYRTSKYSKDDVVATHKRILHIIDQIINDNDIVLRDIEIVTPEEKHKILFDFNNTKVDYPKDKTVVQLFEEQVEKTPDNIAVVFEDQKLTYKELNEKANQLAHYLIDNGVKSGDIVSLFLDKSLEMIIGILGILKVGGAFLPLDISYPKERLDYIIDNCNSSIVLTTKNITNLNISINSIYIDLDNDNIYGKKCNIKNIQINSSFNDLAYIMYTSGSTGTPKGVMISNKNIVRLVKNPNFIKFDKKERILQTGSIVFDACTFEIWAALLNGFELYIIKKEDLLNVKYLENYLNKNKITILWLTAPLFNQLCENNPNMFENVKYLLTGGDVLSVKHINIVKKDCPKLTIINGYGPTENTTFSCCYTIDKLFTSTIPIGKPISNSTCYIVSSTGNLQPIGVAGELWVGGDGVGKGYLKRPELTNEKFISNPFSSGTLYKTGDLVKWTNEGNIEFLGRIDNQVKIRGFRVELNEINSKILEFPNINEAFTTIKTINGSKIICSYIGAKNQINISDLKIYLQKLLPSYMIPTYFITLDKLPINVNGKVDKNRLPEPNNENIVVDIVPPRNKIDDTLINIIKDILHIDNIGINNSFFDLGGDSLNSINLCLHISKKLNVQITIKDIFNTPIISDLSDLIASKTNEGNIDVIPKVQLQEYYPVSSAQKRMYYASSLDGESSLLYNIAGGIILDKVPDINKLEQCFKTLINRHEALRTYFEVIDGNIVQKILENIDFKLKVLNSISNDIDTLFNEFVKPFNLNKSPLFDAELVIMKDKSLLLLNMHHIISDGTSLSILIDELCNLYNSSEELPELTINYKDFAVWENNKLNSNEFNEDKEFWVNQFSDEIPLLNMPTNYPRPNIQSFEGDSVYTATDKNLTEQINLSSRKLGITPYMLLLSAYYILLYKYTGQDDIIVGSPIVGRDNSQLSNVIGMFVNSLALRSKIAPSLSFNEFANSIKTICLQAFEHQTYPFDELVNKLDIKRDTSRNPLFDTMFIYQNNGNVQVNFDGISAKNYIPKNDISKFDLSLEIIPDNNCLNLRFEYCTKLFNKKFIDRLSRHYINILQAIINKSNIKIADICMLSEVEKNHILLDFNKTAADYPKDKNIIQLFEEQAKTNPNNIAIIFEDKKLTYKELNEKANQLAHYLISNNVKKGNVVGIMLERSFETVISMLAVLKANATYMLIDYNLPDDRILYMLNNASSPLLITTSTIKSINFKNKLFINEDFDNYSKNNFDIEHYIDNDLSVVYTSGSTGSPKGILLKQQSMVNLIENYKGIANIENLSNFLSICSTSFDMFAVEIFIPILNGKTLFLANEEEHKDPISISKLIKENNIDFIMITPSKIQLLLTNDYTIEALKYLKSIQLGGEVLTPNLYNCLKQFTNAQICNEYGPSEITSCCSYKEILSADDINIGKPINNVQIYILNNDLNLCPIGVEGEICVSGDGVSKGYINNPTATNNAFIKNPFGKGLLYKTGDIGKYNSNGEIEYIGRKDFQVKLRGLRIELSEIEKQLLNIEGIKNCSVIYKEQSDSNSFLAGFYTSNKNVDSSYIREELSKHLPLYMVPKYIIKLDALPITRNGKIDLNNLKSYEFSAYETTNYVAPENELQELFCNTWSKLLNTKVGINNDIFELGADSLIAIKFKVEMLSHNIDVQYADIFKYPTVKGLVEAHNTTISKQLDNFDYTQINSILEKNNIKNYKKVSPVTNNNVLLLGANGFVGMHILYSFIKNDNGTIYCIIRDKNKLSARTRFLDTLHFYFDDELDKYIDNRIIILKGDITKDNFGLSTDVYSNIVDNVSIVINSSANVKHYGNFKDFENINIGLTEKAIEFCEKYDKRLIQLSTTSVCGTTNSCNVTFSENNLYIGQTLDNVYIKSKFEAEKIILSHIANNNLKAQILRLGNVTNRYSDGKFQINPESNAFIGRLQSFIKLGVIPDYLLNVNLEFTPVDLCGDAIILIMQNYIEDFTVFHIFNNNCISMKKFIEILTKYKISLKAVNQLEFNKIVKDTLMDNDKKDILSGIVNELNLNSKIEMNSNIDILSEFSRIFLNTIDFNWQKIDNVYIDRYINYMKYIKFI